MIQEKIIHQVWVGEKSAPEKWMQTWKDKHPDWIFMRWDNESIKNYPFINKNQIDSCMERGLYHGVSDIMGYQILYDYGGFIAPADSICLNAIDELMDIKEDCFTCYENERKMKSLVSLHLASIKGCNLMKEATEELKSRRKIIKEPWISTGNLFLTKLIKRLNYLIKIYPSHYFIPIHYTGIKYDGSDKAYAEHMWGTTKNLYQ